MIPVAIVSHNSRTRRAERLAEITGAEYVSTDDGTLGPGLNHDRAWRWIAAQHGTWGVVLEDDAIPVKDCFQEQLEKVLRVAPSPIVSLYLGRSRPRHWQPQIMRVIGRSEHFLTASTLLHHVGVAMRIGLIPEMLRGRNFSLPIDESIGEWAQDHEFIVSYTHPSIVDHDIKMTTTIMERISRFSGESSARDDPREVRKAWTFGSRSMWDNSIAEIPEPVL